jgi:hypothetical protein
LNDQGVFAVHRGIWDHPIFAPEPYTEREAWLWLISHAVWKPTKARVRHKVVALERGQLAYAIRFLAEKWGWSKSSVHRFLGKLSTETMIVQETGHDLTLITICNYNRYAFDGNAGRDTNGTRTGHERDKEEEGKKVIIDDAAAPRGSLVTPEAIKLTEKLLVICGHDLKFWPPGWIGAPMRVQAWMNEGWKPELIVVAVQKVVAKARGRPINSVRFFENAIAEEVARQSEPLPIVEIREADKLTVTKNAKAGGYDEAYDRVLAKLNAGFAGGLPEERIRPEPGETDARLLPYRRSQ